jgi:hypothetical protein
MRSTYLLPNIHMLGHRFRNISELAGQILHPKAHQSPEQLGEPRFPCVLSGLIKIIHLDSCIFRANLQLIVLPVRVLLSIIRMRKVPEKRLLRAVDVGEEGKFLLNCWGEGDGSVCGGGYYGTCEAPREIDGCSSVVGRYMKVDMLISRVDLNIAISLLHQNQPVSGAPL